MRGQQDKSFQLIHGVNSDENGDLIDAEFSKTYALDYTLPKKLYPINQPNDKCTLTLPPFTGKSGRHVEDHLYVVKGRKGALFGASKPGGGLYFTVDLPGVSKDDVQVYTCENEIRYYAENKNVYEHDENGRAYSGGVVSPSYITLPSVSSHTISWDAEFGVLKVHVTPPGNTNNN